MTRHFGYQQHILYILRHITHATLLATFSLTSIVWLTQALKLIEFIVNQGVSIGLFLKLTMLLLPGLLLLLLPLALLGATLFVYHRLKTESELVALQAAGLGPWKLARPALIAALGVTLIGYMLSLYLMPLSYGRFKDMQAFLRHHYVSVLLQEGVFSSPIDGLTVFICSRDDDGVLHGILVHDSRDAAMSVTMMAESGRLAETNDGPRFFLHHGNRQELRDGKLSLLNFDEYTLDISHYASAMEGREPEPQEMGFAAVWSKSGDDLRARAELHHRLIWPAYALSLALMALAILLSGEFSRRNRWRRNVLVSGLAALIVMTGMGMKSLMATNALFVPLAYLNMLLPAGIALWWFARNDGVPINRGESYA